MASGPFISPAKEIPWWRTAIGAEERETIAHSLANERISQGPVTQDVEAELCRMLNVDHAVVTTSGSVALLMACMALDIGPGDEVVVPTRTFIATAHAPLLLGAKVVLVDCLPDSTNVDPAQLEARITSRTKAIMPVHLNGHACRMAEIEEIAARHGVPIIEDAAQALFSKDGEGQWMGTRGAAGCYSFGMVKLISSGQGGAVVTRSQSVADRLRAIRNHGVRDVISHEYLESGCNFKFTDILASIALWQVRRAPEKVAHCNRIYRIYAEALRQHPHLRVLPVDVDNGECAVWTEVQAQDRGKAMDYLAAHGIQTRKFLPCLHTARHLATDRTFPNSEKFNQTGFNLPCGPTQPLENVARTIEVLTAWDGT